MDTNTPVENEHNDNSVIRHCSRICASLSVKHIFAAALNILALKKAFFIRRILSIISFHCCGNNYKRITCQYDNNKFWDKHF